MKLGTKKQICFFFSRFFRSQLKVHQSITPINQTMTDVDNAQLPSSPHQSSQKTSSAALRNCRYRRVCKRLSKALNFYPRYLKTFFQTRERLWGRPHISEKPAEENKHPSLIPSNLLNTIIV